VLSLVLAAATTEVDENVDGGPWEVLPRARTAATTEVDEDVDGGPPGRCYRELQQWPPPELMKTSMVGPLGGVAESASSSHHRS
jgi:hypothetical protein